MTTYISLPLSGASPYWGNAVLTPAGLPLAGAAVGETILSLDTNSLYTWDGAAWVNIFAVLGDVFGPGSSTDTAVAVFDGATGKVLKGTNVTIDGADNVDGIQTLNAVNSKIGASGSPVTDAVLELDAIGALLLTRLTTAQIAGLSGAEGMIVFNVTTSRFQGYFAGSWADLHGWGS